MTSLKIASVGAILLAVGLLHAHLESSVPADGSTLASPPDSVELVFSDPVSDRLAEGTLVGAGDRRWELSLEGDTANARIVRAELPALGAGGYRLKWRVVSAEGALLVGGRRGLAAALAYLPLPGTPS